MTTRHLTTPATTSAADSPTIAPPADSAATVATTAASTVPPAVNPASVATATSNPAGVATATPTMATATGHGHTPGDSANDMSIDTASVAGLAVATGRGQPTDTATGAAGMPATSTAARRPLAATAAARVLAEFIVLTSLGFLAFGVGRWLALLTTGTAPAGSGWSAAAGMLAPAGWLDPLVSHVLAQGEQAPSISLDGFLNNVQAVIFGLLATLTTTFLFIGFARWIAAQEPGEYEEAKKALKNAGKGFVGALLSPTIVSVLQTLITGTGRR